MLNFVFFTGAGEKAFCAGGDVVSIVKAGKESDLSKSFFKEEYKLNCLIGTYEIPYIALIDGESFLLTKFSRIVIEHLNS